MLTVPLIKLLKAKEILSSSEVFVFTECINVDGNKIKSPFLTIIKDLKLSLIFLLLYLIENKASVLALSKIFI